MLKLLKSGKQRLIALAVISVATSGCASGLPPPPDIDLYSHHQKAGLALCTRVIDDKPCDSVDIKDTDKWYMLTPGKRGWEGLSNYIDELIRRLEARPLAGKPKSVEVTLKDLYRARKLLDGIKYGTVEQN